MTKSTPKAFYGPMYFAAFEDSDGTWIDKPTAPYTSRGAAIDYGERAWGDLVKEYPGSRIVIYVCRAEKLE